VPPEVPPEVLDDELEASLEQDCNNKKVEQIKK
jgi:hypothetical protein